MNILFVADTHGMLNGEQVQSKINGQKLDLIVFLGDHSTLDLNCVCSLTEGIKKIGILGNHDTVNLYDNYEIENCHMKSIEINRVKFGGYGGCVKYKEDSRYMFHTQLEAHKDLITLPKVDVFITHDQPRFEQDSIIKKIKKQIVEKKFMIFKKIKNVEISEKEYFYSNEITNNSHEGLSAIYDYIHEKQPKYHFHGHLHEKWTKQIEATSSNCIYKLEVYSI